MIRKSLLIWIAFIFSTSFLTGQTRTRQNSTDTVYRIGNIDDYVRLNGYKHKTTPVDPEDVYIFKGLFGPREKTIIPYRKATSWKTYSKGSTSRLCIFLLDTTSTTWLGIANGLNSIAVPFSITNDVHEALKHKIVLLYPPVVSKDLNLDLFQQLRDFPKNGGVLIGFNLAAPSMGPVFGFKGTRFSASREKIQFDPQAGQLVSFCTTYREHEIYIGNFKVTPNAYESCAYLEPEYKPLATYEDGSAAVVRKVYNKGLALAMGIDLGHFTLVSHFSYASVFKHSRTNGFDPTLDVFYRIIKRIYLQYASPPVTLGMVPDNQPVAILITHDVDTRDAVPNSLIYADLEHRMGVRATYNIQTKYIRDGEDTSFFNADNLKYFKTLKNMGMEIASHSVSHTPFFSYIPMGTGDEMYPLYQPLYITNLSTFNETVLGELRVSKFLLDQLLDNNTVSFRAGYLDFSQNLHRALAAVGFRYSSSTMANNLFTHLPFQTLFDDQFNENLDVYEIPVTIEDEELPPMYERLNDAIFVTEQISKYGGVVNILIHPNVIGQKLEFLREYLDQYQSKAWFGSMSDYGSWFRARIHTQLDVTEDQGLVKVHLYCPYHIKQLPILIPSGMRLIDKQPARMEIRQDNNALVISDLVGSATLTLQY